MYGRKKILARRFHFQHCSKQEKRMQPEGGKIQLTLPFLKKLKSETEEVKLNNEIVEIERKKSQISR